MFQDFCKIVLCALAVASISSFSLRAETQDIKVGNQTFSIPLVPILDAKIKIAYLNLKDNTILIEALANEIANYINANKENIDVIITPEANTIALAHAVSLKTGIKYIVLTKKRRPDMGAEALSVPVKSITTAQQQELWISEENIKKIKGQKVLILDDVVSTGGTLNATTELVQKAGGLLTLSPLVCFHEGKEHKGVKAISSTVLPIIPL